MTEVYRVRHLERQPLGTSYPAIVARVGRILSLVPGAELAIDFTGVGRPIYDMFHYAGISPIGITITGGSAETRDGSIWSVPKLSLISRLQSLLHLGALKIHREIPDAAALVHELQNFRVQYSDAGHLTFNARSGRHDDLVLALAIATWVAHGGTMSNAGIYQYYRALAGGTLPEREVVGVDLGQSRDPTAICVIRRVEPIVGAQPPDPEPLPSAESAPVTYTRGSVE